MSWNFKRGIDHTTGTDDANTYFVDGGCHGNVGGDDTTGDGSSSNPWKTLTHAFANTTTDDYIIIAPSLYLNDGYNLSRRRFIGDSLNRDVIIEDGTNSGKLFTGSNAHALAENLTIKGYERPADRGLSDNYGQFINCVILDCNSLPMGAFNQGFEMYNSIVINTPVDIQRHGGIIQNCLFYNSNLINNSTVSQPINFKRCFFDENSKYIASTGVTIVTIENDCHVNDLTTFDNGDNTNLVLDASTLDEQGSPALWVSPSFLDLAVQIGSPLLFLDSLGSVGNVYRGLSFSPDQPDFITTVTANPDVEIVNSNIQLVSSVPVGESRTVEGFSITASAINRLSTALQIGISVKCEYVFEVRWADPGVDINTATWKPFRLGEPMTQNADGTTTAEAGYDWGDNNFINYKTAQGRLVLTQTA